MAKYRTVSQLCSGVFFGVEIGVQSGNDRLQRGKFQFLTWPDSSSRERRGWGGEG